MKGVLIKQRTIDERIRNTLQQKIPTKGKKHDKVRIICLEFSCFLPLQRTRNVQKSINGVPKTNPDNRVAGPSKTSRNKDIKKKKHVEISKGKTHIRNPNQCLNITSHTFRSSLRLPQIFLPISIQTLQILTHLHVA